jgi:ketosteroid isomerase-like protein
MMKRLSIWFALSTAVFLTAATPQEKGVEIRRLLTEQVAAWNAGDIDGYMKGYWNSDSTVFVSGGNLTRGYRDVLARYHKSYNTREKMGKLEFSELLVRPVSPNLAVATGIWRLTRASDQPWGRFTLLIEKKAEGWRIVYDHTSSAN